MTDSNFYLGRAYDPIKQAITEKEITYDPADLTTHAVVMGMTGSGKTGLCVILLEEAALNGIPAIIIDPKGDLTNLLLHFPDMAPQDFQPWIDSELARRAGRSLDQIATDASVSWREGLKEWGMPQERVLALKNAAQFSIFTPGSDAGIPVSVLSSLAVPEISWQDNREVLREKITSTVTALLGLVGYTDIDPLRSREHILLANIFEAAWSQGKDVELTELILQTQTPPFDKLGAFPVETFFPAKDRMELAMVINNILAAPAFETWREGQSLNIGSMLYTEDGRPRHNIFYLAHLSDAERMFFVTLLLSAVETWMRTQSGATSLRALLYMDEIYGYLPPQRNPPSKQPLLRMLKNARAFGLGLLLATQNPVDVDYKALSNAGTWFIGKLQTEQDKNRLLDGLESAAGGISRMVFDKLISSIGKRVFVLHNIHAKQPELLQTRWTMNFLAGPITRDRIGDLNKLANVDAATRTQPTVAPVIGTAPTLRATAPSGQSHAPTANIQSSSTKPPIPAWIREYFLPQNYSLPEAFSGAQRSMPAEVMIDSVIYRPTLLASAEVHILDRKHGVDSEIRRTVLVKSPEKRGSVRWEDYPLNVDVSDSIDTSPAPSTRFSSIDAPLNDVKLMTALQKDFTDWVFRNSSVKARANQALKVFAGPDVSQAEFMKACAEAARDGRDAEIAKKSATLDRQLKTLEDKLAREERELREDEAELSNRKVEEAGTHLENLTGLFGGRRKASRLSSSLTKRRMTEQAKSEVEESLDAIDQFKAQLKELEKRRAEVIAEINDRWGRLVNEITEVTIAPKKTDVFVKLFGVAWMPHYVIKSDTDTFELPAFGAE
ncbi:MAG: ATP-binding protein [Chloroflexi bacterium]|nr:MAG: ATP-binding protein [Chloroflexota bacterium]